MKLKAISLLLALMLCGSFTAPAQKKALREEQQPVETAEEMATIETDAMSVELELIPEQTEKLSKINEEFFKKKKALKDKNASDQEFFGIYEARDNSLKAVLNQKQFKTWKNPLQGKGNNNGNDNNENNGNKDNNGKGNNNN